MKPKILVSTPPYQTLVKKIVQEEFDVISIVPLKANPHFFEPTSKEIQAMEDALLWYTVGEPFEKKAKISAKRKNEKLTICDLHQKLIQKVDPQLIDVYDRHYWLSPELMSLQLEDVLEVLIQKFPEKQAFFELNAQKLKQELIELDQMIQNTLKTKKHPTILVAHPAFGYFCKKYGVVQLSLEFKGKEATFSRLEHVLSQAKERNVRFALALPEHDNKGAQLIAEKLRIPVFWIDPYSSDYTATMQKLAHLIGDER